ncbi:MAG: flagellar protein FliS [Lachnospiraceae bacterium]|nr:flagellar protein FliS [Lachnospiraceae bacterium]
MNREEIKAFTLRVTEANSCDLIVILYDIVLCDIRNAKKAYENKDLKEFTARVHDATRFMNELISSLNYEGGLARDLLSLYSYCNKRLASAVAGSNPEALDIVTDVITKLRDSFKTLAENDTAGPLMRNAQSVYAGLTYGKGCLNETYVDAKDYNRGFRA